MKKKKKKERKKERNIYVKKHNQIHNKTEKVSFFFMTLIYVNNSFLLTGLFLLMFRKQPALFKNVV